MKKFLILLILIPNLSWSIQIPSTDTTLLCHKNKGATTNSDSFLIDLNLKYISFISGELINTITTEISSNIDHIEFSFLDQNLQINNQTLQMRNSSSSDYFGICTILDSEEAFTKLREFIDINVL